MCPPEIRNVHGKHNSYVTAKRDREDQIQNYKATSCCISPGSTLFATVKRAPGTKYNILEKFTWHPFFHTMDYPKFVIVLNQKVKNH